MPVSDLDQCTVSTDSWRSGHADGDENNNVCIIKGLIKGAVQHSGQYEVHECMHLQRWTSACRGYMHKDYFMRLVHDLS